MKPITISPVSLVLGALVAVGLFLVMGQAGPGSYPGSWGPPKKSIVNIFSDQSVQVPGGASHLVYQVPTDRWFTVTGAYVASDGGDDMRWTQSLAGADTDKGFAASDSTHTLPTTPAGSTSAMGWVFRPGSQVRIRNAGGTGHQIVRVVVLGYESRD